tara:strand:+ start:25 stop:210 length:186 start_codon:yes stop_codon:yes gene_type:complete
MRVYDKKFIVYCYGKHWHINWLKNSDVTLEEFFEKYDVEIVDTDIDGEEINDINNFERAER